MKVAIDGADRPTTNDVLEQLLEVINHPFDFRKKVSVNMELMQSNAARMATYGIVIGIPQLTLTLWPTSRPPPNPITDVNFDLLCMPSARSTHTITYTMRRRSKLFCPTRCTCTKRRNSTFSRQFGIIPQFYDAEQRHRLGIHRISLRC